MTTEAKRCPVFPFDDQVGYSMSRYVADFRDTPGLQQVQMPYGGRAWYVVRDADVREVLTNPVFSRTLANAPGMPRLSDEQLPLGAMSAYEGEDHTRLRRLLNSRFAARAARAAQDEADERAVELVLAMKASGPTADIVPQVCRALPTLMMCSVLGIPQEERGRFSELLQDMRSWRRDAQFTEVSRTAVGAYVWELVEERRAEPGDDFMSELVRRQQEEQNISDVELLNLGVALLGGGIGTPTTSYSGMVYVLLTNPDAWQRILDEPEFAPRAIEEMLRYMPSGTGGGKLRVATEDIVVGGTLIRAGDTVLPAMGAADRDPAAHPNPDTLDWERSDKRHLAFGVGGHRCPGSEFARVQALALVRALRAQTPNLAFAGTEADSVRWLDDDINRGPAAILVRW